MFHFRALMLGCLLLLPLAASAADNPDSDRSPVSPTIAVADFSGADPDVARFISETLLTDLAQSRQLHFAERSEIRRAFDELKLQSTGRVEPQQVRQLGRLVSANRMIVGSYMEADGQIIINARLLDVGTGRLAEGGAGNVTGERRNLLSLVHRLAHLFHRRVTGSDFVMDGEGADRSNASRPRPSAIPRSYGSRPALLFPSGARLSSSNASAESTGGFRIRETGRENSAPRRPVLVVTSPPTHPDVRVTEPDPFTLSNPNQPVTGLIIDARGQNLERCMSPKILRADGSELWGSINVDPDYVIANGIVSYANSLADARKNARAGNNPLIVRCIGIGGGKFHSDAVVSEDTAAAILQHNKRDRFLNKFRVIFVVEAGQ